mmetsp:Transcript_7596/g.9449  ORF Transcript_7596/g.9449 Transcript_7596/m.9449 type:complete len:702 (+) Transcript_7596:80-2185(+)
MFFQGIKDQLFSNVQRPGNFSSLLPQIAYYEKLFQQAVQAGVSSRQLTIAEIRTLEENGNWSLDWSQVQVIGNDFQTANIRNCCFVGRVVVELDMRGASFLEKGIPYPNGLYSSTLGPDVLVGPKCLVKDNGSVSHCIIATQCVMVGNRVISGALSLGNEEEEGERSNLSGSQNQGWKPLGEISSPRPAKGTFGNGLRISLGPETGGTQKVPCYADMKLCEAAAAAMNWGTPRERSEFCENVEEYTRRCESGISILGRGSVVRGCSKVIGSYIGEGTILEDSEVINSTVLATPVCHTYISSGAIVQNSLVQWGAKVQNHAIVMDSMIMEQSSVENHAKVFSSVVGPDSGVAAGECHHSLLGPFVGFHHQSLLIAALWPLGRGNIAYGANVGSNHTSRAADQEIWPGEGVFFGLSTVVKFPCNLTHSPYSVIAAGTTMLPQQVMYPFSLISPSEQADMLRPTGLNHLRPGWVLENSFYMVQRAQRKFSKRKKAVYTNTSWDVFRPTTVNMMIQARAQLQTVLKQHEGTADQVLTEQEVPGLGKNYTTRSDVERGIASYSLHIQRYALRGLLNRLHVGILPDKDFEGSVSVDDPVFGLSELGQDDVLHSTDKKMIWLHQKAVLMLEYPTQEQKDPRVLLEELKELEARVTMALVSSKSKDDIRGAKIIPNHSEIHTTSAEDEVIAEAISEENEMHHYIEELLD